MNALEAPPPPAGADRRVVPRALLVDDSAGQRLMLSRMLTRWGYRVTAAESGDAALRACAGQSFDLVLSDWMMPGMDGLEFCRRFRGLPLPGYAYFILLTARSDKADAAAGLDAGADDFVTKPVDPLELRARIAAGARIVSMQRELSQKNQVISDTLAKLQTLYDAIDRDLRQARRIQQALVPERSRVFGRSRVSLLLRPCGHVGGDLVGMFSPGDGTLGFYAIDVSGHGITSAMMTARVAGYLSPRHPEQNVALEHRPGQGYALRHPVEVMRRLNERLTLDPGVDEYLTMHYATVDLASGRCLIVQAGHPPALHLPAGRPPGYIGEGGLPIGLVEGVSHSAQDVTLAEGDRLLLFSDGFIEAATRDGGMLGPEGLLRLVAACGAAAGTEFLDDLFWRLAAELPEGEGLQDDVSAALLEFAPSEGPDQAT
ncbi:PP2C family protein-serine/threonine phosphatase [Roseivivax isoporae]|uniref:Chemotaxis protein CheY n=1 Tax=Roseivivax isoporae LMG 25204 TaxID=1449351 RepID=X7FC14_9RHOB|nr:SpoIIE family protein phosphatase [Roseivivax isoporae]ETX29631.1 chemotaxis protein CheY [Roseivivax isoporae LMG 25204]